MSASGPSGPLVYETRTIKASSVDPDQTALKEQSDLDLLCLPICPNM